MASVTNQIKLYICVIEICIWAQSLKCPRSKSFTNVRISQQNILISSQNWEIQISPRLIKISAATTKLRLALMPCRYSRVPYLVVNSQFFRWDYHYSQKITFTFISLKMAWKAILVIFPNLYPLRVKLNRWIWNIFNSVEHNKIFKYIFTKYFISSLLNNKF